MSTAKPIYQDDPPPPRKKRRKKYPRGKYPRPLTSESRDVKLLRLPYGEMTTLTDAANLMGIDRRSLQINYFYSQSYLLPDYIQLIRDGGHIVAIKRIGP